MELFDASEAILVKRQELQFSSPDRTPFICECGDPRCTTLIALSLPEYERVRSDSHTFAVVAGHDDPSTERVTRVGEHNDGFVIVRKHEDVRAEPEATDPRR